MAKTKKAKCPCGGTVEWVTHDTGEVDTMHTKPSCEAWRLGKGGSSDACLSYLKSVRDYQIARMN